MKNSESFNGNSISFYRKVCSKKQDPGLVNRLNDLDIDINELYSVYDNGFNDNNLEEILAKGYDGQAKTDLTCLYEYKSATLQELKRVLTTTNSNRVVKCQNCTINDVNSFDHLLPVSEFAEFAVHPKNLICSCTDCNGRKGAVWRNAGRRTSLNLYLDMLPEVQYLFVVADVGYTSIETRFYLSNQNEIDPDIFSLITEHYRRLNLAERFSESADSVITSLKSILEPLRDRLSLAESREIILESVAKEKIAFGFNYWQAILKQELVTNDDFMIDFE